MSGVQVPVPLPNFFLVLHIFTNPCGVGEYEYIGCVDEQWVEANVIQTQTPLTYGNSSGGVFDSNGRLLGIEPPHLNCPLLCLGNGWMFILGDFWRVDRRLAVFNALFEVWIGSSFKWISTFCTCPVILSV